MKALVRDSEQIDWRDVPDSQFGSNDVLIAVRLVGLCRTDLAVASGELAVAHPRVLGHEFVGTVIAVGAGVADLSIGDNVAADPVVSCGSCARCRQGWGHACDLRQFLGVDRDGAIAETIAIPYGNAWRLPKSMDDRVATLLEPVAACAAVGNASIKTDERGVIYGNSRLSILTERILRAKGFNRLSRGVAPVCDQFDFAVDTAGTSQSIERLMNALRPGGQLVLKSRPVNAPKLDIRRWLPKQPVIRAVNYAPFEEARRLLCDELEVTDLLGPTWSMKEFEDAFQSAAGDDARKHFIAIPANESQLKLVGTSQVSKAQLQRLT